MRELLAASTHLGCISRRQAAAEVARGFLRLVECDMQAPARPIGITTRRDWRPTAAQRLMIEALEGAV